MYIWVRHKEGRVDKSMIDMSNKREYNRKCVMAKMGVFDGILVLTVCYGCELWALNTKERKKVDVL